MTVSRDVMTKDPVCATPDDSAEDVARLMKENDIGPVPIVEGAASKKLVGIVTDRDLALKVVAEGRDPSTTRVRDVMTQDVVTCRVDDEVDDIMRSMSRHQLRRILVVDENDKLIGIIAQADIATRINEPEKTGEVVKEISE